MDDIKEKNEGNEPMIENFLELVEKTNERKSQDKIILEYIEYFTERILGAPIAAQEGVLCDEDGIPTSVFCGDKHVNNEIISFMLGLGFLFRITPKGTMWVWCDVHKEVLESDYYNSFQGDLLKGDIELTYNNQNDVVVWFEFNRSNFNPQNVAVVMIHKAKLSQKIEKAKKILVWRAINGAISNGEVTISLPNASQHTLLVQWLIFQGFHIRISFDSITIYWCDKVKF